MKSAPKLLFTKRHKPAKEGAYVFPHQKHRPTESGQPFVSLAQELSQQWQVDADIFETPQQVTVSLHLAEGLCSDGMTRRFSQLLHMADRVAFSIPGADGKALTVSLEKDLR